MAAAIRKRRGHMANSRDSISSSVDNHSSVEPHGQTFGCYDFSLKEGDVTPADIKLMYSSTQKGSDSHGHVEKDLQYKHENEMNIVTESPRQHNASRPQSAVAASTSSIRTSLPVPSAAALANATFKVNTSPTNSEGEGGSSDSSDYSGGHGGGGNKRGYYYSRGRNAQRNKNSNSKQQPEIMTNGENLHDNLTVEAFSPVSSPVMSLKFDPSKQTSIVHRDISQRTYVNGTDDGNGVSVDDCNNIAINREQRINAMMESRRNKHRRKS